LAVPGSHARPDSHVPRQIPLVDELGRLARRPVAVVFHNTLASSEYGLLDQNGFTPRLTLPGGALAAPPLESTERTVSR
jgi:hypothetical protein